ncbi:Zinc finger BED domain-containing protein 5 [Eumeta japonica]|uniref:Zinc finger BED domain-containing protein 5 n=1 Tax=Eumeta variegata TaxID=151549 RepID=A0A4C1VBE1_EUMVA|nr:Zinc finger BED domain-containing protein 5 [Eumeta japonica]
MLATRYQVDTAETLETPQEPPEGSGATKRSEPPEFSLTGRNTTTKAVTSHPYFVRVWYLTGVLQHSNDAECLKAVRVENTAITDPDDDATTTSSTISNFGFIDSNGSPLCMLCSKLFSNSAMAPAKLRRHLETEHTPSLKTRIKNFFVRKKEQLLESQKNMMHVTQTINEKATEASYLVSYRIEQAGEAHTIAENLIKPCVLDITKNMLDEKSAKQSFYCTAIKLYCFTANP